MDKIFFWVLLPYDALVAPFVPYFWVRVTLGIATGLFIPRKTIGLVTCALGNGVTFAYGMFVAGTLGSLSLTKMLNSLWSDPLGSLMISLFVFIGVVWWVVGGLCAGLFIKFGVICMRALRECSRVNILQFYSSGNCRQRS
jgi:hypothetical protein